MYEKNYFDYFTTRGLVGKANSNTQQRYSGKILSKIKFNGGTVEFVLSFSNRLDLAVNTGQQPRVEQIQVKDLAGNTVKQIKFNYDYFIAGGFNATTATANERKLMLTSVEILENGATNQQYSFTYNGTPLPPKDSYAQDHWGYYNGHTDNQTLIPRYNSLNPEDELPMRPSYLTCPDSFEIFPGADRSVNTNAAKAGTLEQITYPTGGSVSLTYESNDVSVYQDVYEFQNQRYESKLFYTTPLAYLGTLTTNGTQKTATLEFDIPANDHTQYGCYAKLSVLLGQKPGDPVNSVNQSATAASLLKTVNGQDQLIDLYTLTWDYSGESCDDNLILYPGHYKLKTTSQSQGYKADALLEIAVPVQSQFANSNVLVGGLRVKKKTS